MFILKKNRYKKCKWKNGLGFTEQVYIYPPESSVENSNFDFRFSMAKVDSSGPFSLFPGYKRFILVLEGEGINLSTEQEIHCLGKYDFLEFNGGLNYFSDLIKGPIKDFNFIWAPEKISVEYKMLLLPKNSSHFFNTKACLIFYFVLEGEMILGNAKISTWDCLVLEKDQSVNCFSAGKEVRLLCFILSE